MIDPSITYFPVGNGDTIWICLSDQTDIIIDCNITADSTDDAEKTRYDVHAHLLKELKQDSDDITYADAFVLTHADEDHCRGYCDYFYSGDPSKYSDKDKDAGRIRLDELWFTPRLFQDAGTLCDDAKAFRREVERRMDLHRKNDRARSEPGNRLRIIGYSDSPELEGLEGLISIPGQTVSTINGGLKKDFSFFIHAPFREDTDSMYEDRNETSLVLLASFAVGYPACTAFFGGDAGCDVWNKICERSEDANLRWDIFTAPHHCSWSFFSSELYKDNKEPSEDSLSLLKKKRDGGLVVASCKPIKDDDDNPPHYAAKALYVKAVGSSSFYATMEHPDQKQPLPLTFELTKQGPRRADSAETLKKQIAVGTTVGSPKTYG